MAWILTFADGKMKMLVNAYLPVVLLLTLILILHVFFKWVTVSYKKRKTKSDIDQSVVYGQSSEFRKEGRVVSR